VNDPVAPLIPWYATGRLSAAESARVEEHLAGCNACRDLLALARGFRRLAPQLRQDALFDHVQAQRLVEFAEDPSALEPEMRRFVTSHIQACTHCAEALEILEDMGRSSLRGDPGGANEPSTGLLDRVRRAAAGFWDLLKRSVLRPVPALAYLAALLVLLVSLPVLRPGPVHVPAPAPAPTPAPSNPAASQIALLPPAIELPGEVIFRNDSAPPAPLVIGPPAASGTIVLSLVTDLATEDLSDPAARFRLVVTQTDRTVLDRECRGPDFDRRGRLLMTIDPATIASGTPCLVRILRAAPGHASDGEELYRRTFVVAPTSPSR
jgi:anti-sigma factor RsiW